VLHRALFDRALLHRALRWRGVVAVVAVVAVAAGVAQTRAGHAMLRKAGLFEEPASYTSLAFQHPQALPEQLQSKRANVDVSFVIHNVGSASHDYVWSVLLVQGGHTRRVGTGGVRVPSGRGAAITRSAEISCAGERVRIVVALARPAEFIDAWTTCWSPRS
jgi:hypothetical protein